MSLIDEACDIGDEILDLLKEKNKSYRDSVGEPVGIFAKGIDLTTLLRARIDDKLSRMAKGHLELEGEEEVCKDLIGYLLFLIALNRRKD